MPNWGLIDHATASAPLEELARILAEGKAREAEQFKRQGDIQTRGINERKMLDEEAQTGLKTQEFGAKQATVAKGDQEFEQAIASAPEWQKPVLRLQRIGVKWTPQEALMSPEAQHAQNLEDASVVAARAAAAKETEYQRSEADKVKAAATAHTYRMQERGVGHEAPFDPFTATPQAHGAVIGAGGTTPVNAGSPAQTATDEAFLKSLPQPLAIKVKMLADGTFPMPTGAALKDPGLQQAIVLAKRYDPSFEGANYATRAATQKDFTSGATSKDINSLNTAIQHVANLDKSVEGLSNFGGFLTPLNYVKNFAGSALGNPEISRFNVDRKRVGSEIVGAYDKGGGSVADREAAKDDFSVYGAPAANKAAISETIKLLKGKIASIEDQYQRGMGSKRFSVRDIMSPEARQAYEGLLSKYDEASSELPPASHFKGLPPGPYNVPNAQGVSVHVIWDGQTVRGGG